VTHEQFLNSRLTFIGAGAMATAIIAGIRNQNLLPATAIIASDPYTSQLETLSTTYGINTTSNNQKAVSEADIVLLAIKPQTLAKVSLELQGKLPAKALVISILAGATIANLQKSLAHNRIIRVMPNTPALIGKGISAWTSTSTVTMVQKEQAQAILTALGEAVYFDNEDYLDMATALSGGGPAYMFLFMEALIDAAVQMGFTRPIAQQFVYQTLEGSVALARNSDKHPVELRNMVSSPGGTTVEGLYQLEKGGFRTAISKAIWAAYQKSQYLGELK